MKHVRTLSLFLMIFMAVGPLRAQKFLWEVDFLGFFDNREFKAPYQIPQTLFGTRLSPELGIGFRENHQLMAGVSWMGEFGSDKTSIVDWTVYYRYKSKQLNASFGSFPRRQLVEEYPMAMLYDSLLYFNPNINGMLLQYFMPCGYAEVYVDWRSKQSNRDREIFTIASDGRIDIRRFFTGWYLTLNHFAKPRLAEGEHVVDNLMFNPYAGVDLSELLFLDKLRLKAGLLLSMNRNRGDGKWISPAGFLGEVIAEWRFLGLSNLIYAGKDQLTFYDEFGADLHYGDPFYRAPFYDRVDVYAYLLRKKFVECKVSANFHIVDRSVQSQQQLILQFNLDQSQFSNRKGKRTFVF